MVFIHATGVPHDLGRAQFGDDVEDARTADAHGGAVADGLDVDAIGTDLHILDGAGGRAHAGVDVRTLKGRARGAGAAQ